MTAGNMLLYKALPLTLVKMRIPKELLTYVIIVIRFYQIDSLFLQTSSSPISTGKLTTSNSSVWACVVLNMLPVTLLHLCRFTGSWWEGFCRIYKHFSEFIQSLFYDFMCRLVSCRCCMSSRYLTLTLIFKCVSLIKVSYPTCFAMHALRDWSSTRYVRGWKIGFLQILTDTKLNRITVGGQTIDIQILF